MLQDQDLKCQDQDCRISVSSGLETKTVVSKTTRLDWCQVIFDYGYCGMAMGIDGITASLGLYQYNIRN